MTLAPRTILVWVVGAWVAGGLACGRSDSVPNVSAPVPDVVLVSIDSLRADHVGAYGYARETTPFLDSLARAGVIFTNAASTTSWTLPAHAALFTGLYDSTHGLVDDGLALAEHHLTLAEWLRARGYHTAGFHGAPYLHPTFGLAQGFDHYESTLAVLPDDAGGAVRGLAHEPDAAVLGSVTGPATRAAVRRWADADPPRPFFLFVQLQDVHADYRPPAEYAARFVDPEREPAAAGEPPVAPSDDLAGVAAPRVPRVDLYDAEIRFTDDVLRGIFDDLEARGLGRDALVIVTADHGVAFSEHGLVGYGRSLFDEELRVPLVVRWPGHVVPGRIVETQVQIVDVLPTIAAAVAPGEAPPVQGRDLGPALRGDTLASKDAFAELLRGDASQRALRSESRKVLRMREGGPTLVVDLERNPDEEIGRLLVDRHAAEAPTQALWEAARALDEAHARALAFRDWLEARHADDQEAAAALAERLVELGYVPPPGDSR